MPVAGHDRFLLQFAPDVWSPPAKFLRFLGKPFPVKKSLQDAIQSCTDHTRKYEVLASLANRIQPTLLEDRRELESDGYTPANRSSEFAALVEVLVCELYSVLDGVRFSLFGLFPKCRGVQKKSTSQLLLRRMRELIISAPGQPHPHGDVLAQLKWILAQQGEG